MTVTIGITNNKEYIDQNCPELIKVTCYEADEYNSAMEFKTYPFELNIANANFGLLWRALGLAPIDIDFSYWCCGEMNAKELYTRIKNFKPDSLAYGPFKDGIIFDCGISIDRATRYYWSLMTITKEAMKRGESIVWC